MADHPNQLTDPAEIAAIVTSARGLYRLDQDVNAIEISDPPIVVRTDTGHKVLAWLPVDDEDRWA